MGCIGVIIADFRNQEEYLAIKGKTSFPTLAEHRISIRGARKMLEAQGKKVFFEVCDLEGYRAFLRRNGALNNTQNVALYVTRKHGGKQLEPCPEARQINIDLVDLDDGAPGDEDLGERQ